VAAVDNAGGFGASSGFGASGGFGASSSAFGGGMQPQPAADPAATATTENAVDSAGGFGASSGFGAAGGFGASGGFGATAPAFGAPSDASAGGFGASGGFGFGASDAPLMSMSASMPAPDNAFAPAAAPADAVPAAAGVATQEDGERTPNPAAGFDWDSYQQYGTGF